MTVPSAAEAAANLVVMERAFEALDRNDLARCAELLRPDFVANIAGMPQSLQGRAAWLEGARMMHEAVPDLRHVVEDMFAAGDRVAVRLRLSGTHTGSFLGRAGTGRPVEWLSHEIYRLAEGRIAEEWICSDTLSMMSQLGALSGDAG